MSNTIADIVIKGNAVFDGTGEKPFKGGVAISGNKIIAVKPGNEIDEYIAESTKIYGYGNCLVMSGFNDSHTHISFGSFLTDEDFCRNMEDCKSLEECLADMKEFADTHPDNEWVFGHHFYQLAWENPVMPSRHDIDSMIPDRPVVLQHMDFHTLVANSKAIEERGITKDTPNPFGGIIEKDAEGELTGRFYDHATFLFTKPIYTPSGDVYKKVFRKLMNKTAMLGVTSITELYPHGSGCDDVYAYYKQLEEEGEMKIRLSFFPELNDFDVNTYNQTVNQYHSDKLACKGVKQLIDGVSTTYTAYLIEPYTDNPSTCGQTSIPEADLRRDVMRVCEAGVAARLHAIGDGAVRLGLDAIEDGTKKFGERGVRHGLEHLENVDQDDIPRFKELGVVANMQPMHCVFDPAGIENLLGKKRCELAWPMKSILNAGGVLALGTDFPIVGLEPLEEVFAAVERTNLDGYPEGGWTPKEKLTMAEALRAYTYGSAYSTGSEEMVGTLADGMLADVIVIDRNLFDIPPKEILDAKVILTIFDGKEIFNDNIEQHEKEGRN